ncbi:hypothetical protein STVIR_0509 [Streptomyces viridochromogenes Tue57]|uniref:Uncharacterized protein n=1 Tax=Streptomyces viridochromogenes Tue57 TaxID=1160705 RepID=L8PLT9_STRVR|nr:hypothetical protein STVIR_0509 [Streptomyces viridochromogenes Tue57]
MVHLDALDDVSLQGETENEPRRPVTQPRTEWQVQLIESQLVSVVGPFGHRQACHLARGVHVVTHVIHMAGMALVIHVVHVRRMVGGLVVSVTLVSGVSGMVAMAVTHGVAVVALAVGGFGRRVVVVRAVIMPVIVYRVLAVRMVARLARPSGIVCHVGPARTHRPVGQVRAGHVESACDPSALAHHDAHGGLRHRLLDAVQPLRILGRWDATHDQQIRGSRSAHRRPPPPTYLRLDFQPEFRRFGQRDHQHCRAVHRRTPQKAPQVHLRAPSRQA